jgi:G:T-mismatch repair DNA endonuclease (very short patch repair protein)
MSIIKIDGSISYIPKDMFDKCLINDVLKESIIELYPRRIDGAYYIDKFINYLKDNYKISIIEYVEKYLKQDWPTCPLSKEKVGFRVTGKGLIFSTFKRGCLSKKTNQKFKAACERFSKERMGKNNPMYGKESWNKGLDISDPRIKDIADKHRGSQWSEESKEKQRVNRNNHPLKIRHTQKHSPETIEKLRQNTINLWKTGVFENRVTSIELKIKEFLTSLGVNFVHYQQIDKYFVADFYIPEKNLIIEAMGDFFHCNPNIEKYKEPKYDIQKRNLLRDVKKREFYKRKGYRLIELWECDINSGEFKELLLCELKK